jgi:hypothetical protein
MNYELLFKTNPIKPNLVRRSFSEGEFTPAPFGGIRVTCPERTWPLKLRQRNGLQNPAN